MYTEIKFYPCSLARKITIFQRKTFYNRVSVKQKVSKYIIILHRNKISKKCWNCHWAQRKKNISGFYFCVILFVECIFDKQDFCFKTQRINGYGNCPPRNKKNEQNYWNNDFQTLGKKEQGTVNLERKETDDVTL